MDPSPRELVVRAQRKDEEAFVALVRRYERTALAIAYAVVGDASTAGDVTQEAFLRAWQRIGELSEPERFGGWLARIVRNLAADHHRRRKPAEPLMDHAEGLVVDPGIEIDRTDTRQEIIHALATLDELTRSAVMLKYYEGMTSKEIADLLELSQGAVDMRLSRARTELRGKLSHLAASLATRSTVAPSVKRVASDAAK